jgi:hypothetical protein
MFLKVFMIGPFLNHAGKMDQITTIHVYGQSNLKREPVTCDSLRNIRDEVPYIAYETYKHFTAMIIT